MTAVDWRVRIVSADALDAAVADMLVGIRALPLTDFNVIVQDPRNVATAQSYVMRPLEALLDIGRHVMASHLEMVDRRL